MGMAERINAKLRAGLSPSRLSVIDESHRHAGHAGALPGGETHFRVEIVAPAFTGRSHLERHRMVNRMLADEFRDRVHALQLTTLAPEED